MPLLERSAANQHLVCSSTTTPIIEGATQRPAMRVFLMAGSVEAQDVAVVVVAVVVIAYGMFFSRRYPPLPPTPKSKLLTGNLHQMPREGLWRTFSQWSKELGSPIISFRILTKRGIVLNTYKVASELLDGRANNCSERIRNTMYQELVGRGLAIFQINASHPRFKAYRKLLHTGLSARTVARYYEIQARERDILLENLRDTPDEFPAHFRRNAGGVTLQVAYGWTVASAPDRLVTMMEEAIGVSSLLLQPGRWMVDVFPWLRFVPSWFPGAGFKTVAARYRQQLGQIDMFPHAWAKEQIESGRYIESFTSQHLLPEDGHVIDAEEEDIIKWCTAAMYFGGSDTTVSSMETFVLYMLLYPEVQRKAREEIESVCGKDNLPRWDEAHKLPYITAVIKEVLRIGPVAVLGIPHRALCEDVYMGYRIPKDATIIANIRAMAHDPEVYPQPDLFNPERFLEKEGQPSQLDPRKFVFGFGRRVCPGAQLAEASIFVNMTGILAAFDIVKALDEYGAEISPTPLYTDALLSHPKPFKCRFVPRR